MNYKKTIQRLRTPVLTAAALALMAGPSLAVGLVAIDGQWSPGGGTTQIPMWGFASDTDQACNSLPDWTVGPQLTDADLVAGAVGNDLTINLRNCLSEGVSIVIPGQPATFAPVTVTYNDGAPDADGNSTLRTRIIAFTHEAAPGGTASYTWAGVKDGTYLYQSGSHPAKQVQMGLYGALTVGIYPGTHDEVTLLYSEIDPTLHSPPTAATPLGYHPRHYLVNGSVSQLFPAAGDTNHPKVLRFLNAGLDYHVPTLNRSYMDLVAEDGNGYPFLKMQYSVNLAAGKTIDAYWDPAVHGDYVIYDRRGNGMVSTLTVAAGAGQPLANDDSYDVDENMPLEVLISFDLDGITPLTGVLANDTDSLLAALTVPPASASLVSSTASGSLIANADGSFTYTPNANFNGSDVFTYRANDGTLDSNVASVNITVNPVNDAPVAVNDAYDAELGKTLSVAAPGVLGNDNDVDGEGLNAVLDVGPTAGSLTLNADGSFDYTPTVMVPGTDSFIYFANDGTVNSAVAATVNITIIAATNTAPVAVEDFATVQRNSAAAFINLTDNDSDADGNLKDGGNVAPGQINITTGLTTTRNGTVSIVTNGVNYEPKRNFRGTDTFNYIVSDIDGAPSNEVTVRVNVVK